MQYWASLKLNLSIFWRGGGGGVRVLETKVAKFAIQYSLYIIPTDINMYPRGKLSLNLNLSLVVFLQAQLSAHYYFLYISMILVIAVKF